MIDGQGSVIVIVVVVVVDDDGGGDDFIYLNILSITPSIEPIIILQN